MGPEGPAQALDVTLTLSPLHAASALDSDAPPAPEARPRTSERVLSFRAIFEAHYDYVWISLRRLGVSDRDREDVTNEVFFRVHGKLGAYDPSRPIRPWLFAFAVRAASDYRKLARNRHETLGGESEPLSAHPGPMPDEQAIRQEERVLVARGLDTLDLPHRSVFVMHELDHVPVPTIAEALGIPLGTAYTRLRAARQDFAAAIRRLSAQGSRP